MRDLSISVYFARAVLKNAVAHGLDPVSLLRKNRISPRLMLEDNARISIERFADLQVNTMQAMGDESLGYGTRPLPVGCWAMMCHAVIGCETLGQALARYCLRNPLSLARLRWNPRPGPSSTSSSSSASLASSTVTYRPRQGHDDVPPETFEAMDFVARLLAHVPEPRRHVVHSYGAYSSVVRGKQRKRARADTLTLAEPTPAAHRQCQPLRPPPPRPLYATAGPG